MMEMLSFLPDPRFMRAALQIAKEAAAEGEIPVGAVIVKDGAILATGRNRRECAQNALFHAEIEAIHNACLKTRSWRLSDCSLYVTLEPCPMCAGAIINARIPRVIFGAYDEKAGSCGSVVNLFSLPYNHTPEVWGGILEEDCAALLSAFFEKLRES